ncbi:MAG: UDP-N-acetylmuramoyl-L-alanine--D-glutamate ligase [Acidobacteria bacterium]|nr:UDP-N-acetylmuramoyl-L-alanine--D-glutamate ligase [Acidobacteriota bacterium]
MNLEGKKVVVVGLGRSGVALVEFLCRRGARVIATDKKSATELGDHMLTYLHTLNVQLELDQHSTATWLGADLILLSPGVPLSIEPLQRAREAHIPVLAEVELAARFLRGRIVGVTGSNGKTTVTTLIGVILSRAGFFTQVGGNIGTPLTSLVDSSREDGFVVVELSSFQLETIDTLRPHMAAMTNISPDHLDRHGSLGEYINAKRRIFMNQTAEDWAVLNADDPIVIQMMYDTQARPILFSRRRELDEGVFVQQDQIVCRIDAQEQSLIRLDEIPLRGWHNVENVMAAMAAGWAAGASVEAMREAVKTFPGVEHRLEWIGRMDEVDYYNDSKATNVDSTIKALEAFDGNLIVILGGRDKGSSFEPLRPLIAKKARQVLLLGEASAKIASALKGAAPLTFVTSMAEAVERAHELAEPGDTVLLAPACASFDMFENFEHRGRVFKDEVRKLKLLSVSSSRLNLRIEEAEPLNH